MRRGALIWPILGVLAVMAARRWLDVIEVRGRSMVPAIMPGDRLLVERLTFRVRLPRQGDLVVTADPRSPGRELLKRVAVVQGDQVTLLGDNPAASTDSLDFGDVPRGRIAWRVAARIGRARSVSAPS